MSERSGIECLLYEAIRELAYVQESPDHSLCASAKGAEIIERGMKLLGVPDLAEDELTAVRIRQYPEKGK